MARKATGKRVARKGSARKGTAAKKAGGRAGAARKAAKRGGRSNVRRLPPGKGLNDLFHDTLKDVFHAEKQLLKALPKMAKAAQSQELRQAFENHRKETEGQVDRLEQVFQILGERPSAKPCHAMMGLVEEGTEAIDEYKGTPPADAGLIGAAQAVEHYEIARYGTLRTWAEQLGMRDAARLLEATLNEEKKADELLTKIAESMANEEAETAR